MYVERWETDEDFEDSESERERDKKAGMLIEAQRSCAPDGIILPIIERGPRCVRL